MFTLNPNAKYQGSTDDGLAVYAVEKPAVREAAKPFIIDQAKLKKALADRASTNRLFAA